MSTTFIVILFMLSALFLYCGGAGDKYPREKLITCLDVLQVISQALEQNSIELTSIFLYLQKTSDMVY